MVVDNKSGTFGERITQLLREHHERATDLARVCGVSRQTAWKWANDRASVPNDEHIAKMARHWDKTAAFIRYGEQSDAVPTGATKEYNGVLMKSVIMATKKNLAVSNVVLTPEIEGELIDLLYRNFTPRNAIDEDMIVRLVRFVSIIQKN